MIPLALGLGMGGSFRAPMAIVSIGGMIGGGFLALLVSPVLYYIFSSKKPGEKKIRDKKIRDKE